MTVKMEVTAKDPQTGSSATIFVETGENTQEMIALFGDEPVVSNANANWTVTLQGRIRSYLRAGKTQDEIQQLLGSAKMGVKVKGAPADPKAQLLAKWSSMDPEAKKALLAQLKAAM